MPRSTTPSDLNSPLGKQYNKQITARAGAANLVQHPRLNHLLSALPAEELAPLLKHLELVPLRLGDMLYESNMQYSHALFPTTAIVSLHYVTEAGATMEIAGAGNEGMVGTSLFMGGDATPSSAVVHTSGFAYRMPRAVLIGEIERKGSLLRVLLRYVQALITQISQTVVCNRHHSVEQQLSRWLLLTLDRITSGEFVMTQELVANMLGVRRESVTAAASNLQGIGCISYRRGHISVVNRSDLELRACECYGVVKKETRRLLGR